ncbi:MAG: tyrosine-type recombinase/integrase [Bacteroidetes bacterium]|nr:tyrosine-type recombinase/integrase [Bacteroidota bacterium]
MATLKYYPYKETNGKTLLIIVLTFNHERLRLSTGLSVPVKAWDQDDQKIKPLKENAENNKRLREITNFLLNKYDELFPSDSILTKDEVKRKSKELKDSYQVFIGRKEEKIVLQTTLLSFIGVFQDRYKDKFNPTHVSHYNGLKTHLENFQEKKGFKVDFDTIGKDFYLKFTGYLKEIGLKPNTVGSHIKRVKRLMTEAVEDKITTNQDFLKRDFKVIKVDVDTVYLTTDEIQALYEFQVDLPEKRRVRDIFVLNCFTGLRHSDWSKVTLENIHDGKLYVRTQKTDEPVIIPVKPLVKEILSKYGNKLGVLSLQKTNDAIRFIGQTAFTSKVKSNNINKWLEIRTHTARRSFATNAYLAGIPMHDIMEITGHRKTESFLKYIRVTKLETAEKLKDHPFFR